MCVAFTIFYIGLLNTSQKYCRNARIYLSAYMSESFISQLTWSTVTEHYDGRHERLSLYLNVLTQDDGS